MKWYSKIVSRNWPDRLQQARESEDWEEVGGIEAEIRASLFGGAHVEIILDADNVTSDGQRHENTVAIFIPAYSHEAELVIERNNFFIDNRLVRKTETVNGRVERYLAKR